MTPNNGSTGSQQAVLIIWDKVTTWVRSPIATTAYMRPFVIAQDPEFTRTGNQ